MAEVAHISSNGVWLLADGHELFLSYEDFPWFKDVPIGKIINVAQPAKGHFFWPELDVDVDVESIEDPERYPLKAK